MILLVAVFAAAFTMAPYPADVWVAAVGVLSIGICLLVWSEERLKRIDRDDP